jgi:hypothetical protein
VRGPTAPPQPTTRLSGDAAAETSGVIDFYRTLGTTAFDAARRRRVAWWSGLALIVVYFGLRTIGTGTDVLTVWLAAAAVLCVAAPASGLVVLAAVAPFNEPLDLGWGIGAKSVIAAVLVGAIALRWLVSPAARLRPSAPVILAFALLVGSGLGLIETELRWGRAFAELAAGAWVTGPATMLLVFVAAIWIARDGDRRPLVAALMATTIASFVSLADFWGDARIRDGVLGWLVVGQFDPTRLTGVIRSPTSTAALVMLPLMAALTAGILAPIRRVRVAATALSAPLLLAAYLTYNRAVFVALYALAVVIGWRIGRRLGVILLIGGLIAGVALLPWYLSIRGQAVGAGSTLAPGQLLIASDQQRLGAWAAAARMFIDQPIFGQGYRAYRQLSVQFGDPILNAPHNEWLRFFAEQGATVGIIGLAFAIATTVRLARGSGWLGAGLLGAFLSLCIAATFNNVFLFNQVTIPAMILAGTGVALARPAGPAVREDA